METKSKPKVLLAMSGGVDSSVAALLLKKQGYEVIGAFMKNWSDTKDPLTGVCAWRTERKMALKIASQLDIPLITLDFEKQYRKEVIEKMFEKYKKGITPNPDIDCNQKIKFPLLLKEAKKREINLIATGHYARVKKNKKNIYELLRGVDKFKDQSYFIYKINQTELSRCLFPIGDYKKEQIRIIAQKNKFPNYNKKGTVGICFVGKVNLKKFLQKKIKPKKGKILNPEGKIIGEHDGIYYYTIGQRLGPRYGFELDRGDKNKPSKWYVAGKDIKKNILITAPKNHPLNFRKEIIVKNLHLISDKENSFKNKNTKVLSRIRHVGELLPSTLFYDKKSKQFKVKLDEAITGVSKGQAIVLYEGEKVLGGGEISFN
ncbi:MAG: tRNA 2-thiouridine(34) synthase MnmA [Candidatus Pacearchaeota archaeon]|nr:tRNA 2-thiouridine(34) synthase MnmA [Candidatus Pacearchaeota archaeon]